MFPQQKMNMLIPLFKNCFKCSLLLSEHKIIWNEVYFYCCNCNQYTKWCHNMILSKMQISADHLEKLLTLFIDKRTPTEAHSILGYDFVNKKLNIKTIEHYYSIFNRISMEFYLEELDCIFFDGEVEIDESHLFKPKYSFAPHRSYALDTVWLFGICQRNTRNFVLFPVTNRNEMNLLKIIFKFIKKGAMIYSHFFSCYVTNHRFPKKSKLSKYDYIHKFVNHKKEFVSGLFSRTRTNTVENLWKLIKQEIRRQKISIHYTSAIARFYISRKKNKRRTDENINKRSAKKGYKRI